MPSLMSLSFLTALGVFLVTSVSAGSQCYYLNGDPAEGVYRCNNATSGESSCCNAGQICYSNGVCQAGPENHASDWLRVGCTDKTWSSPSCLKKCTNVVPDSSCGIRPCDGIFTSDEYCCDTQGLGPGSLACCKNSANLFPLAIPTIIATIPLDAPHSRSSSTSPRPSTIPGTEPHSSSTTSTATEMATSTKTRYNTITTYTSSTSSSSASFAVLLNSTSTALTVGTAGSSTTVASAPSGTTTAVTTVSSSLATRFDTGVIVSFGMAVVGGLACVL